MKHCTKCGLPKPETDFTKNHRGKDGLETRCRICMTAYYAANAEKRRSWTKNWRIKNQENYKKNSKNGNLKWNYGITLDDFNLMFRRQNGRCLICQEELGPSPHVDHCHKTGKVRGLLCGGCNIGLGKFKDSSANMRRAADYLDRYTPPV